VIVVIEVPCLEKELLMSRRRPVRARSDSGLAFLPDTKGTHRSPGFDDHVEPIGGAFAPTEAWEDDADVRGNDDLLREAALAE
jgi:hypothetical protein